MKNDRLHLLVSIAEQRLRLYDGATLLREYIISTAANGPGEQAGSNCTPRGRHVVREKIGAGAPVGTVFRGRVPTGEVLTPLQLEHMSTGDWITTRILWLEGLEEGKNRGGSVDTRNRLIYIHGCADEKSLGKPVSHGCIRMKNLEIVELFDKVSVGTQIAIKE